MICSCRKTTCQLGSLWREATEANDNLSLLYGEKKHLQESCLLVLDRLAHSRNTLYQEWERGQEHYRVQMLSALPQGNGRLERLTDIAQRRREELDWINSERETIAQRLQMNERAIEAHIEHLSSLQWDITQCSDNPSCRETVCEVVLHRFHFLEGKIERTRRLLGSAQRAAEAKRLQYVQENERICSARLATTQAHAHGLKSVQTRWVLHALFNVGEAKSYQRSEAAVLQMSLSQQFLLQRDEYHNKLWYGKHHWMSMCSWPRQETLDILMRQQKKWQHLRAMFLNAGVTHPWNTAATIRLLA